VKILLVRVSSLGDVLHNMPVVDDLLRHFPDAQIDWVVEEAYVNLVRLHPGVRHIIPFALRRWRKSLRSAATRAEIAGFYRQLRHDAYDLILDTQGLLKTGLIMGMARKTPSGKKSVWRMAPRVQVTKAFRGYFMISAYRSTNTRMLSCAAVWSLPQRLATLSTHRPVSACACPLVTPAGNRRHLTWSFSTAPLGRQRNGRGTTG
jgi:ADP-heptose:LPS heptosyltransferase